MCTLQWTVNMTCIVREREGNKLTKQWTIPQLSVRSCSLSAAKPLYCSSDSVFDFCTFYAIKVGRLKELRGSYKSQLGEEGNGL